MQLQVANPIYDAVFKHLLEDLEVTRQMLSLLIDKDVIALQVHAQEVTTTEHHVRAQMTDLMLRVFRMDFLATVNSRDGKVFKVLIELQKAAAPDFIGRFRKYLGTQYQMPIHGASGRQDTHESRITGEGHLPIIAVFWFGFEMSKNHPKVVRVRRQYVHYRTGAVIEERIPGMELLTHDAVMVQLVTACDDGESDTPLDEMLRVFDQSKCMKNMHYLELDEAFVERSSPLVKRMVRILSKAASDPQTQRDMEAEDELVNYVKQLEETEEALTKAEAREQEERRQKEEERRQKEEERRLKEEERSQKLAAIAEMEEMREMLRRAGLAPSKPDKV